VFAWRQLYRRELLDPKAQQESTLMLPVKESTPTVLPTERARPVAASTDTPVEHSPRLIEIRLSDGHSILIAEKAMVEVKHAWKLTFRDIELPFRGRRALLKPA
jgi:hypothetical protein